MSIARLPSAVLISTLFGFEGTFGQFGHGGFKSFATWILGPTLNRGPTIVWQLWHVPLHGRGKTLYGSH